MPPSTRRVRTARMLQRLPPRPVCISRESPRLSFTLFSRSIIISLGRATAAFSNPSFIDLLATDRLPTVSASDAFRNLSDDHQSPSNAYTNISELDYALGGGFECGRVTELWGPPGAGKTAIAYVECHVREHMSWV